jgi:hypothetical protein
MAALRRGQSSEQPSGRKQAVLFELKSLKLIIEILFYEISHASLLVSQNSQKSNYF